MSNEAANQARPSPPSQNGRRSNSLVGTFIKRTRSQDLLTERKSSSNYLRGEQGATLVSPVQNVPPPTLPNIAPPPQLQTFGGENYVSKMETTESPVGTSNSSVVHTRAESMTHRGRYSYATSTISSTNSPRRLRRRKDPTAYNVLIIGARNSGKTSFLNFLKSSIAPEHEQQGTRNPELDAPPPSAKKNPGAFIQHYQEIDFENERVGLTIWDSQGFDRIGLDFYLKEITNFVESKFEDTFIEEMKVVRSPGYRDTHIHCVFFLFDPAQLDLNINTARRATEAIGSFRKPNRIVGALDEDFELQILKNLQGKTTVIPVISKADTVTTAHMAYLKKMVGESFQQAGLDPLEALHFEGYDSDEDVLDEADEDGEAAEPKNIVSEPSVEKEAPQPENEAGTVDAPLPPNMDGTEHLITQPQANTKKAFAHKRETSLLSVSSVMFDNGYMPMSILSPDEHSLGDMGGPIGRKYIWGFADPYNPEHCDFVKLKETCFTEWRADFKEASREKFYERWRTGRLNRGVSNGVKKSPAPAPAPVARKASSGIPIELTARTKKYS